MNKLKKSALLAAGVALVTQAAQAYTANDMILGFNSTAPNEYVIDLGNVRSAFGTSSILDLSSDFNLSTFNSTFAGGPNGVSMGAFGATTGLSPSVYLTQPRSGGLGNPTVAGSPTPATVSSSIVGGANADIGTVTALYGLTAGGQSGTGGTGNASSFVNKISPGFTSQSWFGQTSVNPLGTIASSVLYEDVYSNSKGAAWIYQGVLALDLSGATPSLTFTPDTVAVPEPATYGLLAGAGLLVLSLRRQLSQKNA